MHCFKFESSAGINLFFLIKYLCGKSFHLTLVIINACLITLITTNVCRKIIRKKCTYRNICFDLFPYLYTLLSSALDRMA